MAYVCDHYGTVHARDRPGRRLGDAPTVSARWEDIVEAPARAARIAPLIVVVSAATDVDHAVDATGTAQHFAAWPVYLLAFHVHFRFGGVLPNVARILDQPPQSKRNVDPVIVVFTASLQEQHGAARVFRQPGGEDASGGSGTNHDIVETAASRPFLRRARRSKGVCVGQTVWRHGPRSPRPGGVSSISKLKLKTNVASP